MKRISNETWQAIEALYGSEPDYPETLRERMTALEAERDTLAALVREFSERKEAGTLYDTRLQIYRCAYCYNVWGYGKEEHSETCPVTRARELLAGMEDKA